MLIKRTKTDYVIDIVVYSFLTILLLLTLYPFLNSLAISLNDANDTAYGGITVYPRVFTLENYKVVFSNPTLYSAFFISVARTVIGTVASVLATGMLAYGMSKSYLKGRKIYMTLILITMFFGGGLLPSFILMNKLHLMNNFLVYILPNLINVWNMIIMMTSFKSIPGAIEESARIDGATDLKIFFKIVIPISMPIIATMALFFGVAQWNSWFDAAIYITKTSLKPLQSVLIDIINSNNFKEEISKLGALGAQLQQSQKVNTRSLTMATMITTVMPIILVYPFLQKYFVKGIMIGSIKG